MIAPMIAIDVDDSWRPAQAGDGPVSSEPVAGPSLAGLTLNDADSRAVPVERLLESGDRPPRWLVNQVPQAWHEPLGGRTRWTSSAWIASMIPWSRHYRGSV